MLRSISTQGLEKSSRTFGTGFGISYKPTNWLVVSFTPGFSKSYSELQYVTGLKVNNEDKYIFASIDRKTFNTSFRVNLNLSPNLTLQYWGQPFFATGSYYDYKLIVDPMADNYTTASKHIPGDQISLDGNTYNIDENHDGSNVDYSFDRRDFNVQEFLSNLVIRWEYNPGSSVYLVWSQTRSSSNSSGNMDILNDLGNLFSTENNKPHNVSFQVFFLFFKENFSEYIHI